MQQRFETFTVLIAKISRSIRRIKAEEMSEFHLKGPHVSCLYYLTQLGPLTAGQLCDRCEEDKAAVSRSLEYLEQNGYVTRPDKRYRSPLTLTEKGQETGRAIAGKIDRLVEAASEGLTPEQRQVMYDALTCISGHLERLAAPPKITERRNRLMTRIIIDSTIDLPEQYRRQVHIVPLTIHFGTEELLDGVDIDRQRFYERLVESDVLPTTSQPSPDAFAQLFDQVEAAGDSAVVLTISHKLSGTYQSACIAAEGRERIFVVDTMSASIGSGILARYAIDNAHLHAGELAALLDRRRQDVCIIGLVDTLEYLKKGGRISKTAAFAGGLLNIHPVLTLTDGEVTIIGKARGSRQGNNLLVQKIHESGGIDFSMPLLLGYSGLSDALLQKYVADSAPLWENGTEALESVCIGSVIGTHAGPGAVVAAFFRRGGK